MSIQVKTESVDATVIGSDCEEEVDPKRLGSVQMKELVGKTSSGNSSSSSKVAVRCCQAEKCNTDLALAKPYHRRHKVCEVHAKAQVVLVAGIRQRFCQQCSRFHEVAEFDESKRSCRRRLAGHNERRRKSPASATANTGSPQQGQGISSSRKAGTVCGRVDDSGRFYSFLPDKHFHIR